MENSTNISNQAISNVEPRIRKESSETAISVAKVEDGLYKKEGQQQAELRQQIETTSFYPSKKISNDMQDNVFGASDFGDSHKEQEFKNTETRVAWLPVPEGMTADQVASKIAAAPSARLYKVMANSPILTEDQKYAITAGLRTKAEFAESQVTRYPDNEQTQRNGTAGKLVLDPAGKLQYRAIFFSGNGQADKDLRTADANDYYASEALQTELAGSVHIEPEQTL